MEGYERIFPHVGGRDIEAWTQRNLLEHNIYHFPPSNMYHYREEVFIPWPFHYGRHLAWSVELYSECIVNPGLPL